MVNYATCSTALENVPEWERLGDEEKKEDTNWDQEGGPLSTDGGAMAVLFLQAAFIQEHTIAG